MWLRDSLPHDLTSETNDEPMARVMIYGYESTVTGSKSMQNLEDFATKFNASLQTLANAMTIRPIILIGHSLGGLIIKQVSCSSLHMLFFLILIYAIGPGIIITVEK